MGDSYYLERPEEVEWAEIEPMVEPHMSVWHNSSELRWGEHAWGVLGKAGLTSYSTEVERTMCLLRALALAAITRNFYVRAFGEGSDGDWREEISDAVMGPQPLIDAFTLGQIAERSGYEVDHLAINDMVLSDLIRDLVDDECPKVGGVLRDALGDAELFASLFAAREGDVSYPVADDYINYVVNEDVTADKLEAHEWLTRFPAS